MPTQNEINNAEWENSDNWGASGNLATMASVYFSKKDSRTWVPKKGGSLGWTINLAHRAGVLWFLGIVLGLPLFYSVGLVVFIVAIVSRS